MIWILLLVILTSSVCGMLVVKMSLTSYQTEENENVTFRWDIQTFRNSEIYLSVFQIKCVFHSEPPKVLYKMVENIEYTESQHQQFAGRVQLDKDALREGWIGLHLSTVTAEDSGKYQCDLAADYDRKTGRWGLEATEMFVLSVSQASNGGNRDMSFNTRQDGSPDKGLNQAINKPNWAASIGLLAVALAAIGVLTIKCFHRQINTEVEVAALSG
ncbi:uncharacterized protein LOC113157085 [Anabas testudineus]|uniref:uncharacterized protein LOC113157085 n=1 Tax=Anabas testudineus TaxID=64144 RepID=UPI000E4582D8|nr:uncharacterized protein LOC113157085 [Anabas testudineus]